MQIRQALDKSLQWLIDLLVFYYVLFIFAAIAGIFVQGREIGMIPIVLLITGAFIFAGVVANRVGKKIITILMKLPSTYKLAVSLIAISVLVATLPLFIAWLPDRV